MLRPRAAEKEFFTLLKTQTSKCLYPIDVEGEDATEPRDIKEEIDRVATVADEADVIVGDSKDEHVSDTPRLPLGSPTTPAMGSRPTPTIPAVGSRPTPTPRADIPEPFVITREMWEEMRASQEQLRASQEQMLQSQAIVLRALSMTGRRVERIRDNQVRSKSSYL